MISRYRECGSLGINILKFIYCLFLNLFVLRDVLFEFYLKFWNTASIVLVFQLEVYYKVDRLLTGLSAQKEQLLDGIQIKHL